MTSSKKDRPVTHGQSSQATTIQLNTVGSVSLQVGDTQIPAANQQLFAAVLYLTAARGKRVPRRILAEMFFPHASSDLAAHSARQLIYRLRKAGAKIEADHVCVSIPVSAAHWDLEELLERGCATAAEVKALSRGYLSDFAPPFSSRLTDWLDEHRADTGGMLRDLLIRQLQSERSKRNYPVLADLARACLALDPLNEEATLVAAETLAMSGSKVEALALLDNYIGDMGAHARQLSLHPRVLRERISEHLVDHYSVDGVPLIGRDSELQCLQALFEDGARGLPRVCFVTGPSGIGKTRLVNEACSLAVLRGHVVVRTKLHANDAQRPFSILRGLCTALLDLPGAIGASSEALSIIRGLCGRGPSPFQSVPTGLFETQAVVSAVHTRVNELVDAVSAEQPVIVCVDDAHWIDEASLDLISDLLEGQRAITIILASQRTLKPPRGAAAQLAMTSLTVQPLTSGQSVTFLDHLFLRASRKLHPHFVADAARMAGGMPIYLQALFRNFQLTGDSHSIPSELSDSINSRIERLSEPARSVFDAVVILGENSTDSRLAKLTKLPTYALVEALRLLEDHGVVRLSQNTVSPAHELFALAGLRRMPLTVARVLHRGAAAILAEEPQGTLEQLSIAAHWAACEEHSMALEALLVSARDYMLLGRPREATTHLMHARQLAHNPEDLNRVCYALFEAYRGASQFQQALELGESLGLFGPDTTPEMRLTQVSLLHMSNRTFTQHVPQLQGIAANYELAAQDRAQAAKFLLIVAEDQNDKTLANAAIKAISDIPPESFDTVAPHLIHETVFGNPDAGLRLARLSYQLVGSCNSLMDRLACLHTASIALLRNGDSAAALQAATEGYDLAFKAKIWNLCTYYASVATDVHWHLGNKAELKEWLRRASEVLSRTEHRDRNLHYIGMQLMLALEDNDPDAATELLTSAERLYPRILEHRMGLERLAYRVRINLAYGRTPDADSLSTLLEGHLARRGLGYHDLVADTLVASLVAAGDHDRARDIRDCYLAQRRDRFPVPPGYSSLWHGVNTASSA